MAMRQSSLSEIVAQSQDVITHPSVATFERYEKRGSVGTAGVYVLVAAVVAGLLAFVTALLPGTAGNPFSIFVGGVVGALVNFVLFTGLVYYVGKSLAGGTGSWDEVAYSFALFVAPLAVVSGLLSLVVALLGWIPLLGALVGLGGAVGAIIVLIAQVYFGYLAVQSSMNISDPGRAAMVLAVAFVGTIAAQILLGVLGGILWGLLPLIVLVALVAVVASMIMRRGGRIR
jgi:hypothetical protein